MDIRDKIRGHIKESGRTLSWVSKRIEAISGKPDFTEKKISATLVKKRNLSADELLWFCMALEVNPDTFMPNDSERRAG